MTRFSSATYRSALALGACLLGLFAMPRTAAADWLVTTDGGVLETDGPWRVDRSRVLFTLPNGTFAFLRARAVDLDASHRLTDQRAKPMVPAEAIEIAAAEPKWTFTDDDIRSAPKIDEDSIEVDPIVGAPGFAVRSVREDRVPGEGTLRVRGTLLNTGSRYAKELSVQVRIMTADGSQIEETSARLDTNELPPGGATRFVAHFGAIQPGAGQVQVEVIREEPDDADLAYGR